MSSSARLLPASSLRWTCDPAALGFSSTEELPAPDRVVGQDRAVASVRFAIDMAHPGYNLVAVGPDGVGRHSVVRQFLEAEAARRPAPPDLVYVHCFADSATPMALTLAPGQGPVLQKTAAALVDELQAALTAAFESEDYLDRRQYIHDQAEAARESIFEAVKEKAREQGLVVLRAPGGVVLAPLVDGEVVPSEQFETLDAETRARIDAAMAAIHDDVNEAVRKMPGLQKRAREMVAALDREVARAAIAPPFADARARHADPAVQAWLDAMAADVVENHEHFLPVSEDEGIDLAEALRGTADTDDDGWSSLRRYRVNVLVSHDPAGGAPVVQEDDPNLGNLLGRIEHVASFGALTTDFTRIRPGALHRASGGFLVLAARRLLTEPLAWQYLKQALRQGQLRIPPASDMGLSISTVSLQPGPFALDVKVVLVADRLLHYLLTETDPEVARLFKVVADFDEDMDRTADLDGMAALVGALARTHGLLPLDAAAVAAVLEHAARMASHQQRLSTHVEALSDLLREADHHARRAGHAPIGAADVHAALAAARYREGRVRDHSHRAILERTIRVPVEGAEVGEVTGLTVLTVGRSEFGLPVRISARVGAGDGEVIDIEDEVELGGPIHGKGVHILRGFLRGRFGAKRPLAFAATLTFEQSYSEVDGDSASMAEALCLLSALAGLPLRADVAVTGSMDQHGRAQAVGGVSDKIEGFFALCRARGLTGTQGVVLPATNVPHLMLDADVVEAVAAGRFHVWAVDHVDEALALLAGQPAGTEGPRGGWSRDSVNGRVARRLRALSRAGEAPSGEGARSRDEGER
ncbi:MAG: AAA family ATPase [Alphaproteobacteria bacterium]|nr:AAA family ATPase [Alphaproteobacteria bacterium]